MGNLGVVVDSPSTMENIIYQNTLFDFAEVFAFAQETSVGIFHIKHQTVKEERRSNVEWFKHEGVGLQS